MFDEESVNYGAIHTNYSSRPGAGSQWFPRSQALIALISNTSSVETRGATLCGVGRVGIHSGGRGKVFGAGGYFFPETETDDRDPLHKPEHRRTGSSDSPW